MFLPPLYRPSRKRRRDALLPAMRGASPLSLFGTGAGVAVLTVVLLFATSAAVALEAPPFGVLLQQSLARAPQLLEQQANVAAARSDLGQSRALLNPRVDVLAEDLGAPTTDGRSARQTTYSVNQPLELGGKRAARIALFERRFDVADARQRQAEVEWTSRLAVAYGSVEAAQSRRGVAADERARAEDDLRAARAKVEAGREAALRVAQAQAGVAAARGAEQAAAAELIQGLEELSALVGSEERFTGITGSLFFAAPDRAAAVDGVSPMPDDSPGLRAARADRDAAEAGVQVEEKRWIPDLSVTAGVRRYAWSSQSGYVVGLSATIPLFDRNRDAVSAARLREQASAARLSAVRLEITASRRTAEAQLQASDGQLEAALEGERAAEEAYRLGRIGFDAGRTPLVELLLARRAFLDAQRTTIDARLARVRARAALAQAEGRLAFGE